MNGAELIVKQLENEGVTDVFGIPGGVILPLLYAFDESKLMTPHLCCHEQAAAFAAMGYARFGNRIGVAYCTKGPGLTNAVTAIADAFYDSIPLIVFVGHSSFQRIGTKNDSNQELPVEEMLRSITKKVCIIDDLKSLESQVQDAIFLSEEGRKGPVVIDVLVDLFKKEVEERGGTPRSSKGEDFDSCGKIIEYLRKDFGSAKRPLILIGDGIKQAGVISETRMFAERNLIPFVSSRFALDVLGGSDKYFGFIGSHGTRCANSLLAKSDLILCLGNRLNYPLDSKSYEGFHQGKKIIRIDVDASEFKRNITNSVCFHAELESLMPLMKDEVFQYKSSNSWLSACRSMESWLLTVDLDKPTKNIMDILGSLEEKTPVICDVGNNEFWVSKAYVANKSSQQLEFSKALGALGNAIGKSIGAFYATRSEIVCFVGDQGFQLNSQELQTIANERLPITIVVINNRSSGMIKDREALSGYKTFVHTTFDSGYSNPDFRSLAKAYGIDYVKYKRGSFKAVAESKTPKIIEVLFEDRHSLIPTLERGRSLFDMTPALPKKLMERILKL